MGPNWRGECWLPDRHSQRQVTAIVSRSPTNLITVAFGAGRPVAEFASTAYDGPKRTRAPVATAAVRASALW